MSCRRIFDEIWRIWQSSKRRKIWVMRSRRATSPRTLTFLLLWSSHWFSPQVVVETCALQDFSRLIFDKFKNESEHSPWIWKLRPALVGDKISGSTTLQYPFVFLKTVLECSKQFGCFDSSLRQCHKGSHFEARVLARSEPGGCLMSAFQACCRNPTRLPDSPTRTFPLQEAVERFYVRFQRSITSGEPPVRLAEDWVWWKRFPWKSSGLDDLLECNVADVLSAWAWGNTFGSSFSLYPWSSMWVTCSTWIGHGPRKPRGPVFFSSVKQCHHSFFRDVFLWPNHALSFLLAKGKSSRLIS